MLEAKERIAKIIEDALVAIRFGQAPLENEKHLAVEAADRISAYLEAVGGEQVAWQRRQQYSDIPGYVPQWQFVSKEEATGHFERRPGYEYRPLYTAPQAPAPHRLATTTDERAVEALPNWSGWRSIDTAPEDCRVILATAGNWVGEAIMLRDEDTGEQVWTWVDTGKPSKHSLYGWQNLPEPLLAPVASDLRPDGFDGPTGAE